MRLIRPTDRDAVAFLCSFRARHIGHMKYVKDLIVEHIHVRRDVHTVSAQHHDELHAVMWLRNSNLPNTMIKVTRVRHDRSITMNNDSINIVDVRRIDHVAVFSRRPNRRVR